MDQLCVLLYLIYFLLNISRILTLLFGLQGTPYPPAELNAAEAVYDYAISELGFKEDEIVLYAWSIGGFPAAHVAATHPKVKAVVSNPILYAKANMLTQTNFFHVTFDRFWMQHLMIFYHWLFLVCLLFSLALVN